MRVNGIEIAVTEWGSGDPLVLLHGWTGNARGWAGVAEPLSSHRRVIAPDWRGHGNSTNTGDAATYTFDQLVADLAGLADAAELRRFDLLGHSMGGLIAQRYALIYPDRVRSLVLFDTGGSPSPGSGEWMQPSLDAVAAGGTSAFYELAKDALFPGDAPDVVAARAEWERGLAQTDPVAFVELGRQLTAYEPTLPDLAALAMPTSVLVGERGLRDAAEDLARVIPHAAFEMIPDAGHSGHSDNPEGWLAAIGRHFARVAA